MQQTLQRARVNDAAALLARAESHVDDCVGDADHVGVVLDDDHGVALIAELPQDRDQPLVVARMQADRGLVEHVQRVDERRAERRREVDALRLAARERGRQPIERQVVEADVAEEPQPLAESPAAPCRQWRRPSPTAAAPRRTCRASRTVSARYRVDRPVADTHVTRFAPQPRAAAVRARQVAAIPAQEHADVHLVFLALEPAEESADAFVSRRRRPSIDESLLVVGVAPRHVEPDAPSCASVSAPRDASGSAACSTARSRPAGSTSRDPARPDPCRAR